MSDAAWPGRPFADRRLTRPDGRIVAWAEAGLPGGRPVLRLPGTPSSRLQIRGGTAWADRGIRMILTERPGFGASTRLPGRGISEHVEDLVAILDELGLDRVPVMAISGGGQYGLALAAQRPDRVAAVSVAGGVAPMSSYLREGEILDDLLGRAALSPG